MQIFLKILIFFSGFPYCGMSGGVGRPGVDGENGKIGPAGAPGLPGPVGLPGADAVIDEVALEAMITNMLRAAIESLDEPNCRSIGGYETICDSCGNGPAPKPVEDEEKPSSPSSHPNSAKTKDPNFVPSKDFKKLLAEMINHDIKMKIRGHPDPSLNYHAENMLKSILEFSEYLGFSTEENIALKDSIEKLRYSRVGALNFPEQKHYDWSHACRIDRKEDRPNWPGYNYEDNPCAHWRLYHTLLSACAVEKEDCSDLVENIINYVKNFYICPGCIDNFKDEIKKFPYKHLKSSEKQVIWLWEVHNDVNKRLGQDEPDTDMWKNKKNFREKIQYPSKNDCQNCKTAGNWNKGRVFEYLVKKDTGITVRSQETYDGF